MPLCPMPAALQVARRCPSLPLFANLRCGLWYVEPPVQHTCYFKSTDGHNNNVGAGMGGRHLAVVVCCDNLLQQLLLRLSMLRRPILLPMLRPMLACTRQSGCKASLSAQTA